jgi:hypothetical protein
MPAALSLPGTRDNPDKMQEHKDIPFHEQLELLAVMRRPVEIVFRSENEARTVIRDRIEGLFVHESRECIRTGGGLAIALDRLEAVDGRRASGAS